MKEKIFEIIHFFVAFTLYCIIIKNFERFILPNCFVYIYNYFSLGEIFYKTTLDCLFYSFEFSFFYFISVLLISLFYRTKLITKAEALEPPDETKELSLQMVNNKQIFKRYLILYFISFFIILFLIFYIMTILLSTKLRPSKFTYYVSDYSIEPLITFSLLTGLDFFVYFFYFMLAIMFHMIIRSTNFIFLPIQRHIWRKY
jgi:hypothetical protein